LNSKVHKELLEREKNELTFKPKINKPLDRENTSPNLINQIDEI